jgi:two-component system phosphate regulon sensor histidine kinase PhoR
MKFVLGPALICALTAVGAVLLTQSVLASYSDAGGRMLITLIVSICAAAAVTAFLSRRLTGPVTEMAAVAGEIGSGELEKRIPVRSADEFGRLAASLNAMLDTLNGEISKLKKLERVRSEFLGNVSHELRTPIFAVQGMLETLLNGALDDKAVSRDFVERALSNTQRLNTLLGDLIEISRIESGDMKMSFRYFTIHQLLEQVVAEMGPAALLKGASLELESSGEPRRVLGDKERLKQVITNLIDNAIKYNRPDGRILVRWESADTAVQVSVTDTGVGIPAEHISRIFERFYRVDKERSREAGGTGLGLAIVKHIVEAHGSTVDVRSEVGKGSTFSFVLRA